MCHLGYAGSNRHRQILQNLCGPGAARGKHGPNIHMHAAQAVIWQVVTLSGRTIRDEAQASPLLAQLAIERIDALLAVVSPAQYISTSKS